MVFLLSLVYSESSLNPTLPPRSISSVRRNVSDAVLDHDDNRWDEDAPLSGRIRLQIYPSV